MKETILLHLDLNLNRDSFECLDKLRLKYNLTVSQVISIALTLMNDVMTFDDD